MTDAVPPCDPSTDDYCLEDFTGVTDEIGNYTLVTDAMPANWEIGATEEVGTTDCLVGATWYGNLTPASGAQLVCGQTSQGAFIPSPQSCSTEVNYVTGQILENSCTSTITLSTAPGTMPTSYAMKVGTYNDEGDLNASNSISASSSSSITVPTPNIIGTSVIIVVDPTTNQVLGAGLFTRGETIYYPCGHEKSC
jgi:hypothetical protein